MPSSKIPTCNQLLGYTTFSGNSHTSWETFATGPTNRHKVYRAKIACGPSGYVGSAKGEGTMEARSKRSSVVAAAVISAFAICYVMTWRAAPSAEPSTAELLRQNFQAQHEIGH